MNTRTAIFVSAISLALAACSSTPERESTGQTNTTQTDRSTQSSQGAGDRGSAQPLPLTDEQRMQREKTELARQNVIYFDFDRAELSPEAVAIVNRHADFLARQPGTRIRLEGHTDERGTREYNIGLGERRARSVASALRARGVSGDQFEIVSYGEERPAQLGSNESAWAQNRRVEIVYQ